MAIIEVELSGTDLSFFRNEVIKGIHLSRYVASWYKSGGTMRNMSEWLRQLEINGERLSNEEIQRIRNFADNGKLELETNARKFIKSKEVQIEKT